MKQFIKPFLCVSSHSIQTVTLRGSFYPHITDGESEVQRSSLISPSSGGIRIHVFVGTTACSFLTEVVQKGGEDDVDSCEVGLGSHVLQMEGLSLREGLSLAQPGTAGTERWA